MNKLTKFWQSGLAAKFATVFVSLFAICCVCSSIVLVLPTPASSTMATDTAAVQKIPTSTTEGLELPSTPTVALLPPVTVESTVLFLPTVTLSPPVTIEASVTFIPTSSPVPTLPVKATAIVLPAPSNQPIRVHFIDVGQGDATLIQTSEGKNILVDGGDTNSGVIQYLQYAGVKSIDVIFATHPHADHIGGLVQVLKTYPVAKVVTNGEAHTTTTYERFLDAILAEKAEYIEAKRGDVIQVGTLSILVLNPAPGILFSDINENSLVLEFSNGPTTLSKLDITAQQVDQAQHS